MFTNYKHLIQYVPQTIHLFLKLLNILYKMNQVNKKHYFIQGELNTRRGQYPWVSVHFAVTFLDCWRTSFCVKTIIKLVNNNTNDKQTFGASLALDEDSPYTNSCCLHQIGCLYYCCQAKTSSSAVQKRHSKVYGNPIAPSFYSISSCLKLNLYPTDLQQQLEYQ